MRDWTLRNQWLVTVLYRRVNRTAAALGQLFSDGTYDYEYDLEGRRTKQTEIATGDYAEYEWDHGGRLTGIAFYTAAGGLTKTVAYAYDGWGRRIGKDVDADADGTVDRGERYVWDGAGGFGHVDDVVLTYDDAGNLRHRYLHGPAADQIFADEAFDPATGGSEVKWALADHQGSVRDWAERDAATGATAVTNHVVFDSFGVIVSQTDAGHEITYAYTGREWDADAGMYYYRARWYDQAAGRFLSEDPLGFAAGDANVQRYVGNGVTTAVDPTGLITVKISGEQYRVHQNDVDDWPSSPHAHIIDRPQKVDLNTGDIYDVNSRGVVGKMKKKHFAVLKQAVRRAGIAGSVVGVVLILPEAAHAAVEGGVGGVIDFGIGEGIDVGTGAVISAGTGLGVVGGAAAAGTTVTVGGTAVTGLVASTGVGGAVLVTATAGYAVGTAIGETEIGGKTVHTHMGEGMYAAAPWLFDWAI